MSRRLPALRNALTVALLLCVLALRVAIPTGYMLDRDARGWPELVVCPAAAPAPVVMAMSGAMAHHAAPAPQHHRHDPKTVEHPCAFSAASAAVDLAARPSAPALPHARADAAALATMHPFVRPGLGLAAPPPPKTGPPAAA